VIFALGEEKSNAGDSGEHPSRNGRFLKGICVGLLNLLVRLKTIDQKNFLVSNRVVSDQVFIWPPSHHRQEHVVRAWCQKLVEQLPQQPVTILGKTKKTISTV
jgi:hypothetical protein